MSAGSNFFICSCAVVIFTIINLSVGPIINFRVGTGWGLENCEGLVDKYDAAIEKDPNMKEEVKEEYLKLVVAKIGKGCIIWNILPSFSIRLVVLFAFY